MPEWILLIYYAACAIHIVFLFATKRKNRLAEAVFVLCLPIVGFPLSLLLFRTSVRISGPAAERDEPSPLRNVHPEPVNFESAANVIPIRDALILNDNRTKRKLLLDSLRGTSPLGRDILKQALGNEDSETSHYAATAIMETNRKILNDLRALGAEAAARPHDLPLLKRYAGVLKAFLESGLPGPKQRMRWLDIYSDVLGRITAAEPESKTHAADKIECDLMRGDFPSAGQGCRELMDRYPEDELPYLMYMKFHYARGETDRIAAYALAALRNRVRLTAEGRDRIYFWLGENGDGAKVQAER